MLYVHLFLVREMLKALQAQLEMITVEKSIKKHRKKFDLKCFETATKELFKEEQNQG